MLYFILKISLFRFMLKHLIYLCYNICKIYVFYKGDVNMQERKMKIVDGSPTGAIYARKPKETYKG